ncbi:ANTAR domain-containing protein [Streptomyces sp. NPDC047002]|uniref:ANTAR domain-containing protein n=1 Tax=Streptomyces sp. NPDC047002 TaxID=3155475 RepID=UPI00345483E1
MDTYSLRRTPPPADAAGEPCAATVRALEEQVAQLQQAVRSHARVDQAIGVLVAAGRISPEEGWDVLREVSMHTNIKLRVLAGLVVEGARTGRCDERVARALRARLRGRAAGRAGGAGT